MMYVMFAQKGIHQLLGRQVVMPVFLVVLENITLGGRVTLAMLEHILPEEMLLLAHRVLQVLTLQKVLHHVPIA
jgi:hypothetical protein